MKKKLIEFLGFFSLRVCVYLVLEVILLFLYDIGSKGGGAISWEFLSQSPRRGMTKEEYFLP